eukprot:2152679-Lingulodinium_polyedra.AAC.1
MPTENGEGGPRLGPSNGNMGRPNITLACRRRGGGGGRGPRARIFRGKAIAMPGPGLVALRFPP